MVGRFAGGSLLGFDDDDDDGADGGGVDGDRLDAADEDGTADDADVDPAADCETRGVVTVVGWIGSGAAPVQAVHTIAAATIAAAAIDFARIT